MGSGLFLNTAGCRVRFIFIFYLNLRFYGKLLTRKERNPARPIYPASELYANSSMGGGIPPRRARHPTTPPLWGVLNLTPITSFGMINGRLLLYPIIRMSILTSAAIVLPFGRFRSSWGFVFVIFWTFIDTEFANATVRFHHKRKS